MADISLSIIIVICACAVRVLMGSLCLNIALWFRDVLALGTGWFVEDRCLQRANTMEKMLNGRADL
eukprot:8393771-Prorocentrum_lima.AAC.1